MVFFDFEVKFGMQGSSEETMSGEKEEKGKLNSDLDSAAKARKEREEILKALNSGLGFECGLDGALSAIVVSDTESEVHIAVACNLESITLKQCKDYLTKKVSEVMDTGEVKISSVTEVGTKEFQSLMRRAENTKYYHSLRYMSRNFDLDFFNNYEYHLKEEFCKDKIRYKEAIARAEAVMGDASLMEELERIYSPLNRKTFYGHPVHYSLKAGNFGAGRDIADILVSALRKNGRLLGSRVAYLYDIDENCYNNSDLSNLFKSSGGNTIVIDLSGSDGMHGIYASAYERVAEFYTELIRKYNKDVLFIFIENTSHPGFAKCLFSKVQELIEIIEIKEGCGDYERALNYFKSLSEKTDFPAEIQEIREIFPKKKVFTATEIYDSFQKYYGNGLRKKIYRAYEKCSFININEAAPTSEPYQVLQEMVGLTEIKEVVDQILAMGKMTRMKSRMGLDTYKTSMHMIFTGNPGSAKTTVARLIAEILKKEGVLDSGVFVECGRADLIARFVGWTAKTVREKFRRARGGVLFIDEAYSLVDGSHSFGDEAINTIVQEMENHREDVIVIFAGYPEKMKAFLEKNEGLRSRIAFHLDFPDYTADEMLDILHLMVRDKGYSINGDVDSKCLDVFRRAVREEEFGNGRFVRNLLEQAMMKQSERLFKEYKGRRVPKKKILELISEDFSVNVGEKTKKSSPHMGFTLAG
ncbi:MAG: AAA family ATPase [Lachnospiraceae bacterium]|nr:AAA family ATPase [Lachnospiraceae bacterium]